MKKTYPMKFKTRRLWDRKNMRLNNIFAALQTRVVQNKTPITLPKINGLTLDEIEKKYGSL